ncbi:trimeric intracellular cation channel family protein [Nocardia aurantia]|nr:TRIC cation channel family protein [Nocardia aurantia]
MMSIAVPEIGFGHMVFTGEHRVFDLIAATTNALNGALLARRPDHFRNFTVSGILLMAVIGGIGGGVARDVLLSEIPVALLNPAFIVLSLAAGTLGYLLSYAKGQLFREGLFQFVTSTALPWYAIVGVQKATEHHVPILGAVAVGVVGPTAGRYIIDLTCGVTPKQFIQGELFVTTTVVTSVTWLIIDATGLATLWCTLIAFAVGFTLRVTALYRGWEEPLAAEPLGVYIHRESRPLLGRKLAGKSHSEIRSLGLDPTTPPPR